MYQPMLFLHWKQIKVALIPFVIAAFGLPLVAVQGLGGSIEMTTAAAEAYRSVAAYGIWMPAYPLLAGGIGITLALSAWNWDHQLNHVYALSLPIPRWQYATLKMGAGALLAALPALGFWIGAHLAAASVALPAGLHAYPNALALRFFLAILVTYATLFAMAAGTVKTTAYVVSALFIFLFLGGALNGFLGDIFPYFKEVNVVQSVMDALLSRHGPLEVFSGSWTLIDV